MSVGTQPLSQAKCGTAPSSSPMIVCPHCRRDLCQGEDCWTCLGCGQHYPVRDGIALLTGERNYAPDGVSRARLEELARQARDHGWEQAWWDASQAVDSEQLTHLEQAVGVETREGWQYLVSLPADATALDLGSGWGAFSCTLAEHVAELYCVDPCLQRLQLLSARAEQRGLHNLHYVHADNALSLPFPDQCFDLVKLGRFQSGFLPEICRVLKPAGQLYVGLDNRFALPYWKGKRHGQGPRFATVMPRWLAHLWCLLTRDERYQTDADSATGAARQCRNAGFQGAQTLVLSPDPRNFDRVFAPGDAVQLAALFKAKSAWKRQAIRMLGKAGGLAWLAPAFGIIASPTAGGRSFLEQVVRQIGENQHADYQIEETHVRDYGGCVLFLQDRNEPQRRAILKLTQNHGSPTHLERANENVARMAVTLPGKKHWLPRVLERGSIQRRAYVLEERMPGCNGWQMMARGWSAAQLAEPIWDFLLDWMRSSRSVVLMNPIEFARWVPYQPEAWHRLAGPESAQRLAELIDALSVYMVGQKRVVTASHGDFSLGNVLFDEATGSISAIVDWDSADPHGLPLLDAISLSQYREPYPFDLGFPDEVAAASAVGVLAESLRRVSTCPDHPRLPQIRSEFGYPTDRDAFMALFLLFLKRHQPGSLALRKQTRKWIEAFAMLLRWA